MSMEEMQARIQVLIEHLDTCIADAEANERRCSEAGQMASSALWDGTRTGFFMAKKAVLRVLLDQKTEVQ